MHHGFLLSVLSVLLTVGSRVYATAADIEDPCKLSDADLIKTYGHGFRSYHSHQVDESLKLSCLLGRCPGMQISWRKDKMKLFPPPVYSTNKRITKTEFFLRRVSLQTSGTYTCTATKTDFSVTQTFIVDVRGGRTEQFFIKQGLADKVAHEGEDVIFKVLVESIGSHIFAMLWQKDGKVLQENNSVTWGNKRVSDTARVLSLQLKKVSTRDSGKYTLTILGFRGKRLSAVAKLVVTK